jgi:hypothetical protein
LSFRVVGVVTNKGARLAGPVFLLAAQRLALTSGRVGFRSNPGDADARRAGLTDEPAQIVGCLPFVAVGALASGSGTANAPEQRRLAHFAASSRMGMRGAYKGVTLACRNFRVLATESGSGAE